MSANQTVTTTAAGGLPRTVPEGRDLAVDLVRVVCVLLVVVAHLLLVGVGTGPDGAFVITKPLQEQPWFARFSAVTQMMPLFFTLGGFAAITGLRSLRARGGTTADFLRGRLVRLLRPSIPLFAFLCAVILVARALGAPAPLVDAAIAGVGTPLWFLAAFVLCQWAVPGMVRLHERAPWLTLAALAAAAIAVDALRAATGITAIGLLNTAFVWLFAQQLGFLYADGVLFSARRRTVALVGVTAAAALAACVSAGVYSPDMLQNQYPPQFAIAIIGVAQVCALALLHPALSALMRTRPARAVTFAVGSRLMTVYLWHLPCIVAVTGLGLLIPGGLPEPGGALWWATRPLVLAAALGLVFLVSLAVVRFERPARVPGPGEATPPLWRLNLAALLAFVPPFLIMRDGLGATLAVTALVAFSVALLLCRPVRPHGTVHLVG